MQFYPLDEKWMVIGKTTSRLVKSLAQWGSNKRAPVLVVREELLQNPFDVAQLSNKLISDQFARPGAALPAEVIWFRKKLETMSI